jgi:hypothetical protein
VSKRSPKTATSAIVAGKPVVGDQFPLVSQVPLIPVFVHVNVVIVPASLMTRQLAGAKSLRNGELFS